MVKKSKAAPVEAPEVVGSEEAPEKGSLAHRLTSRMSRMDDFKGTVHKGNSASVRLRGVIPSGSPQLDAAIGRGGFPFGRVTIVTGGEGAGKTTLALQACASVQKMGGIAVYIDAEHKLDPLYASQLGVNIDELIISKAKHFEQGAMTIAKVITLVEQDAPENDVPIIVVMDSLNAAMSEREWEGEFGDTNMGSQARAFSAGLPKLIAKTAGRKIAYFFISQYRMKITSFGAFQEKVSGGYSPKYYATLVIDLKAKEKLRLNGETGRLIGHEVHAEVIKNQVAAPHKECTYNLIWGKGIDYNASLLAQCVAQNLINSGSSAWYEMPNPWHDPAFAKPAKGEGGGAYEEALAQFEFVRKETLKWQGAAGFERLLDQVPALQLYLEEKVRERFK